MSLPEEFLIKEIVSTHDPGDCKLDSELLLHLVESTFCSATSNDFELQFDSVGMDEIDLTESKEPVSLIIHKISNQIIYLCFENENLHKKTRVLLETLSHYRWDAKVVLAFASFAQIFGLFMLIFQLQPDNELAVSLSRIKRLPNATRMPKPKLKAMASLINTMVKLTKFTINFEGLSSQHYELLDDRAMHIAKSKIHLSTYWIFRSIIECSSGIADFKNSSTLEQVYSDDSVIEACSLHSLGMRLNNLCHDLERYLEMYHEQIDTMLYQKMLSMFKENHIDNQKVLKTLFPLQHKFPLKKSYSQEKCGILELKSKIVIFLISKPELMLVDNIFLLIQRTYDDPQRKKFEGRYEILWVPIPSPNDWSLSDKRSFETLSDWLPWFSIRWPSSLNPLTKRFIEQEWKFKEDPLMVVLDENGIVTNTNAMDMVWIWGPKAFPFSTLREKELWGQENWTLNLMIDGISPLLTQLAEEGRNICVFGSDNLDWIREFSSIMKNIKSEGIQLEVVYVGCKNSTKNLKTIIDTIYQEKLCTSLSFTKVQLFWFRLEVIKKSIVYQENTDGSQKIANELTELLDFNDNEKGWAMIGKGSSIDVIKLHGKEFRECVELFPIWCKNVETLGLVGAIRSALEPPFAGGTCNHVEFIPFKEELEGKTSICSLCRRPMETFVMYKCDA